jgi:serine/threonine protein phosphatase PrpC
MKIIIQGELNAFEYPLEVSKYKEEDQAVISAIYKAFEELDNKYRKFASVGYDIGHANLARPGACALVTINFRNKIYVANLGDSQGLLIRKNNASKASSAPVSDSFDDKYKIYQFKPNATCKYQKPFLIKR